MAKRRFVSYLRVSTARQGASGLGPEAQRSAVAGYLQGDDWTLVREVVEIESGTWNDRPALAEALRLCRSQRATLVIAKLDRLARNVVFIATLIEEKVPFVAVDMPSANEFTVHIFAAVAQDEAKRISERTKAALTAAKTRGTKLGGLRIASETFAALSRKGQTAGAAVRAAKAQKFREDAFPVIHEIQAAGFTSLRTIAAELNARGETSTRGGPWSTVQVQRRLNAGQRAAFRVCGRLVTGDTPSMWLTDTLNL